ncbi:MAG: CHASE domain-containing protein [Bacteroidales bacterium]
MKENDSENLFKGTGLNLDYSWKTLGVLFIALSLTAISVYYTRSYIQKTVIQDFEFASSHLQTKMDARLRAHAHLLRSGSALFAVSDTVTREIWQEFYENKRVWKYFPGMQGFGYAHIIPNDQLENHIQTLRENGFPDYNVFPADDREIYTSIIYLEPFTDRNLLAFGYDMFSEPVRRQAMEEARDSNHAVLSGKVILMQEANEDHVQAGALMYIPVYRKGMPVNTVDERRTAISGWVYSPYRINDLTEGILGNWDLPGKNRIRLRIFDTNDQSEESVIYDSQGNEEWPETYNPNLSVTKLVNLNGKEWTMVFTKRSSEMSLLHGDLMIVLISGLSISLLLFLLSSALINTNRHARQIDMLNTELEKHNADKDRFISILGHDLRNPFNSILGFLEILVKDMKTLEKDKIEVYVHYINAVTKNTYHLLEDLLQWTKAQSGQLPFEPKMYNLKEICQHVYKYQIHSAREKNITVSCLIDNKVEIFADRDMLKSILRNLLSNAIKFTGNDGKIKVNAEKSDRRVVVCVSDNGIGIEPENRIQLFGMSDIISTRGTANEAGTGLGLMLCKEFVSVHGGKIWVDSEPGKGSAFYFSLPLRGGSKVSSSKKSGKVQPTLAVN